MLYLYVNASFIIEPNVPVVETAVELPPVQLSAVKNRVKGSNNSAIEVSTTVG